MRLAKRKSKSLVVVESPAKARTISGILGGEYDVRASVGHVRDLPKSDLGVDVENGFQPKYVIPRAKSSAVKDIRKAAASASTVYLATDPDREGEAIAWHLIKAANLEDKPHRRVVFQEITAEAVREAFEHPRSIDMQLVDAQQARRVLDRLVGYRLSPFLWRQVRRGLSAGRVQSVAVRLVVEREREIQNFVPREYWTIDAQLAKTADGAGGQRFRAGLAGYAEDKKRKLEIGSQIDAERLTALLSSSACRVTRSSSASVSPSFSKSDADPEPFFAMASSRFCLSDSRAARLRSRPRRSRSRSGPRSESSRLAAAIVSLRTRGSRPISRIWSTTKASRSAIGARLPGQAAAPCF